MPGGFWIFLLIVVANLVITIIKKTAEKRAKLAGGSDEPSSDTSTSSPARRFTGEGDHEMILERAGDHRIGVVEILRKDLRWDLPTAMALAGTTPSVVATGLTRSEAGYLRNRFEAIGAGVSVRRSTAESASTVRDLDLDRRPGLEALPKTVSVSRQRAAGEAAPDRASRRIEALRRRTPSESPPPSPTKSTRRETPARPPTPSPTRPAPPPATSVEFEAKAELPELRKPREARRARGGSGSETRLEAAAGPSLGRRIRAVTRSRRSLREAFLLQELLRPPLSLRSTGSGGRDS